MDRVQLYDLNYQLLADTDTLDLTQNTFVRSQDVKETPIDKLDEDVNFDVNARSSQTSSFSTKNYVKKYSNQKNLDEKLIIGETINNNFYVMTIDSVKIDDEHEGYIVVSEIANDILIAVDERKNFILRTVFLVALAIFIFSFFLNNYILKPIRALVLYTKAIKRKKKKKIGKN